MSTKFNWDATNSMQMLLLVISEADLKPSAAVWTQVASKLGHPVPSAVSQKFYKLKKECEQLKAGGGPSTPKSKANGAIKTPGASRGRKRKDAVVGDGGSTKKRAKKDAEEVAEEEPEEEPEMEEAQDGTKIKENSDGEEIAV